VRGKAKAHQLTLAGFFCFKSAKSIGAIKCLVVLKHTNSTLLASGFLPGAEPHQLDFPLIGGAFSNMSNMP
jgi:hypothetical protein